MEKSPTTSAATSLPCYSGSCEKYDHQKPAASQKSSITLIRTPPSPVAATAAHTQDPAESTSTGVRISTDSAYNSEHEETREEPQGSSQKRNVRVTMIDEKMWKRFNAIGNEMIVTKPGRRLFPALMVNFRGLEPTTLYDISFRIAVADQHRYKFIRTKWQIVCESEIIQNEAKQIYHHPNSPNTGLFWMKKPVSFRSIKITHHPVSMFGNIHLHTMHKYLIKIIVTPKTDGAQPTVLPLKETTFVAVTAYQNLNLTQLKIDNNPFAKGFRERSKPALIPPHMMNYIGGIRYTGNFGLHPPPLAPMIQNGFPTRTTAFPPPYIGHPMSPMFGPGAIPPQPLYQPIPYPNYLASPPSGYNLSSMNAEDDTNTTEQ